MFNYTLVDEIKQFSDVKFYVTYNKECFNKKPDAKNDAGRIQKNMFGTQMSLIEIAKAFASGQTMVLSHLGSGHVRTRTEDFVKTDFLGLDFDHGDTLEETLKFSKERGFEPVIIYQSFSHTEQEHRFRFIYKLDRPVVEASKMKILIEEFHKRFQLKTPDAAAKSVTRVWYGTNKNVWLNESAPPINVGDFDLTVKEYVKADYVIADEHQLAEEILKKHGGQIGTLSNEDWQPIVMGFAGAFKNFNYQQFEAIMIEHQAVDTDRQALNRLQNMHKNVNKLDINYVIGAMKRLFKSDIESKVLNFSKILWFEKDAITLDNDQYVCDELVFSKLQINKKLLVVAPAGAGKTTSTMKVIKNAVDGVIYKRAIFALPTKIAVEQISVDAKKAGFNVANQYAKGEIFEFERGEKNVLICTFNKLQAEQYDDQDTLVVVDEVHLLNDFNSFSAKVMTYVRNIVTNKERTVICLTATPHALLPNLFDDVVSYKKSFNKTVSIVELPFRRKNQLAEFKNVIERDVLEKKKTLIYMNSKQKGEQLKRDLAVILPNIAIGLVNADNKHSSDDFQEIIENATFVNQVVICTKLLNVAVSIKRTVGTMVAINLYDLTELMQLINRERGECRFLLLYKENQLRKLATVQKAIDNYAALTDDDIKRVVKHNAQSQEQAKTSHSLSNKIISISENITDTSITWVLTVDEWLHKYNYHYKEIIKSLDPNDIQTFLKQQNVNVRVGFSDADDLQGDETEEQAVFEWKNTKEFFKKETKLSVKAMKDDVAMSIAVDKHLHAKVDKREHKRILFVIQHADEFELLQKHNVTSEQKLSQLYMLMNDFKSGTCTLKVFLPLLRSLKNNQAIYFTSQDKREVGLSIGKKGVTDRDCMSAMKKIVSIKRVQIQKDNVRFYEYYAEL